MDLLTVTLALVAGIESSNGLKVDHKPIRNPASIQYGTAAIGRFGMMPKTLLALNEANPTKAARKLAKLLLARNSRNITGYLSPASPCPYLAAVVLWERGPFHTVSPKTWFIGHTPNRLSQARLIWPGVVYNRGKAAGKNFL